jgi:hypothetical protein
MNTGSADFRRHRMHDNAAAIAACLSILSAVSVQAQQQTPSALRVAEIEANSEMELTLGDVVVVARKREELAKDVPVAETVLSGAVLDRDCGRLLAYLPR